MTPGISGTSRQMSGPGHQSYRGMVTPIPPCHRDEKGKSVKIHLGSMEIHHVLWPRSGSGRRSENRSHYLMFRGSTEKYRTQVGTHLAIFLLWGIVTQVYITKRRAANSRRLRDNHQGFGAVGMFLVKVL
jgi:hypothetical protein